MTWLHSKLNLQHRVFEPVWLRLLKSWTASLFPKFIHLCPTRAGNLNAFDSKLVKLMIINQLRWLEYINSWATLWKPCQVGGQLIKNRNAKGGIYCTKGGTTLIMFIKFDEAGNLNHNALESTSLYMYVNTIPGFFSTQLVITGWMELHN